MNSLTATSELQWRREVVRSITRQGWSSSVIKTMLMTVLIVGSVSLAAMLPITRIVEIKGHSVAVQEPLWQAITGVAR